MIYALFFVVVFSKSYLLISFHFHTLNHRYFIVKSCNRENLELSVQQGVWATQRSNEAKLNEAMPDLFGMGPRPFDPFGPRFPAGFVGPASGMMFHNRPMGGGFGMMMGPTGRAPFMGGMGVGAAGPPRSGRPVGMPQMFQPPPSQPMQNMNHPIRRDQRGPATDKNERYRDSHEMSASGTDGETLYKQGGKPQEDRGGNDLRNDESESEDEAPRRSRHGEGKKKRRGLEADATTGSDQ